MDEKDAAAAHVPLNTMRHGKAELEALQIAQAGGWEVDALITTMEQELEAAGGPKRGAFTVNFKNPKHFTWMLVAFASMGGLLSGLDQSLISGANLYLPKDLGLSTRQNSLVNSGMPLGAVGGALLLSPVNEYFGRKRAILIAIVLYTIGAALEAGSISFGKCPAPLRGPAQLLVSFFAERPLNRISALHAPLVLTIDRDDCRGACHSRLRSWPRRRHSPCVCRRDHRAAFSRQPRIPLPVQHRPGRSLWLCRRSHLPQSPRQLALYPGVFACLLDYHVFRVSNCVVPSAPSCSRHMDPG